MSTRLADVLHENYIIADIKARDKREAIDEMVDEISSRVRGLDRKAVLDSLLDREKLGSTGIGHGVAIPHGKIKGVNEIMVFFGRSRKGVDFNSMDKQPVYLFFIIIVPEKAAVAHLKILASISHLLKNQEFRVKLMRAQREPDIYRVIVEADRHNAVI
ncbi:MAG: PTS sugar transporter subunit IIA [Thermodesulfobacteriota bacterium]